MEFYVQLQTPVVEITIEAIDGADKKSSLLAGFKRYDSKEADEILKSISVNTDDLIDNTTIDRDIELVRKNILYLKKVVIDIYDQGVFKEKLTINDTRNPPKIPFWETPEECLSALVTHFLESTPWKVSFFTGFMKALTNLGEQKEQKVKNY